MTVITMSCNELTRLRVLIDVADGRLSVEDATGLIGVGRRQIYRLLQAFHADGPDGLISRKRGGPSNRALRDCLGELVQIGGSEHWWFEDRGPQCTLLVYVDDATSRLMHLKLVETEATFGYFQATREYLEAHGKPVAFYSDKHGVFRVNNAGAVQGRACPCEGGGHDPVWALAARPQHRHSVR